MGPITAVLCPQTADRAVNTAESISVVSVNPLTTPHWNAGIAKNPNAGFFHRTEWLSVLHDTYGFTPLAFTARVGDETTAALPMMEVNSVWTGRRGVSLPFTDECEPISSEDYSLRSVFDAALAYGRSRNWKYIECRGDHAASGLPGKPAPSLTFFTHHLDLDSSSPQIFGHFESSVRRAIRKAEKAGLKIDISRNIDAVRTFYELHCQTRKRHGLPPQPFQFFLNIHRHVLSQNLGMVITAYHNQEPIAAAMFFQSEREAIYKFGASSATEQEFRPNNLVMWSAIQHYVALGKRVLKFGRTSLMNEGLRRFKLGWGSQEGQQHYYKYDLKQNRFVVDSDDTVGWHTRVFRAMPLWLSRLAGAALYRHIA